MMASSDKSSFSAMNEDLYGSSTLGVGKFVIKAQYGDDIRRFPIGQEVITLGELRSLLAKMFKFEAASNGSNEEDIVIKYRDEDNDLVTVLDDNDLSFALQESPKRILKLLITYNNAEGLNVAAASGNVHSYRLIKEELVQIRDRCNKLLVNFEQSVEPTPTEEEAAPVATATVSTTTEAAATSTANEVAATVEPVAPLTAIVAPLNSERAARPAEVPRANVADVTSDIDLNNTPVDDFEDPAIILSQPYPTLVPNVASVRATESGTSLVSSHSSTSPRSTPLVPAVAAAFETYSLAEIEGRMSPDAQPPPERPSAPREKREVGQQTVPEPSSPHEATPPPPPSQPRVYEVQPIVIHSEASLQEHHHQQQQQQQQHEQQYNSRNHPVQTVHPMPHSQSSSSHRNRHSPPPVSIVRPQPRAAPHPPVSYVMPLPQPLPDHHHPHQQPMYPMNYMWQAHPQMGPEHPTSMSPVGYYATDGSHMGQPPPMMMPGFVPPPSVNGNPFGFNRSRLRQHAASGIAAPNFPQN